MLLGAGFTSAILESGQAFLSVATLEEKYKIPEMLAWRLAQLNDGGYTPWHCMRFTSFGFEILSAIRAGAIV